MGPPLKALTASGQTLASLVPLLPGGVWTEAGPTGYVVCVSAAKQNTLP